MISPEKMPEPSEGVDVDPDSFVSCLEAQAELSDSKKEELSDEEALEKIKRIKNFEIPTLTEQVDSLRTELRKALGLSEHAVLPKNYRIPDEHPANETNNKLLDTYNRLAELENEVEQLRKNHPTINRQVIH